MKAFEIRHSTGKDINFIYDTWLNSYRYDSPLGKSCKNSVFFNEYKLVLDRVLSSPDTTVLVAHSVDNKDLILAYLAYEPKILHYVFCKEAFRRLGIATALFLEAFGDRAARLEITHRTGTVSEILRDKQHLTHNPFHLFKKGA